MAILYAEYFSCPFSCPPLSPQFMELRFECPKCSRIVTTTPDQIAKTIFCEECKAAITVPNPTVVAQQVSSFRNRLSAIGNWSIRKKFIVFSGCGCLGSVLLFYIILVLLLESLAKSSKTAFTDATPDIPVLAQADTAKDVRAVVTATNLSVGIVTSGVERGMHPSEPLVKALEVLQSVQMSSDFARCPSDVREAFLRFITAMELLRNAADTLPKTPEQGMMQGLVNGMNGEVDGGQSRVDRNWRSRVNAAQQAQGDVNAVAQKYLSR